MVGSLPPPPNYMTKMANWQPQPSPIYSVDSQSQLRWAHHLDANGQNIYAVIYLTNLSLSPCVALWSSVSELVSLVGLTCWHLARHFQTRILFSSQIFFWEQINQFCFNSDSF